MYICSTDHLNSYREGRRRDTREDPTLARRRESRRHANTTSTSRYLIVTFVTWHASLQWQPMISHDSHAGITMPTAIMENQARC